MAINRRSAVTGPVRFRQAGDDDERQCGRQAAQFMYQRRAGQAGEIEVEHGARQGIGNRMADPDPEG